MSNIFPKLSINRVDVKKQSIKVFASVDTVNSTVRPFWLDDEDFAPFINCNFLLVTDHDNGEFGRDVTLNSFPRAEYLFEELRQPSTRIDRLIVGSRNMELDIATSITLEEIKQNPYGTSPGDPISMDFVSNKLHFEIDIDLSEDRFRNLNLEDHLNNNDEDLGISLVYYSHVNYQEIESHYGITNGQSEVRRLGGVAEYLPLVFLDTSSKRIATPSPNLVSIQIQQDGETPFEGYFGLPSIMMSENEQGSPAALPGGGTPDPHVWRSRINYDSIYGSSNRIEPYITEGETVNRIKKQLALKTVEDHSFALMHHIIWNNRRRTVDQLEDRNLNENRPDRNLLEEQGGEVDAYSSMFVLDVVKVLTRMSPLGFLLDKDFTGFPDPSGRLKALIRKCLQKSDFNLKITRKVLSKTPTISNKVATSDYSVIHTEKDPFIMQDQVKDSNGHTTSVEITSTEEFTLEEVDMPRRNGEDLNYLNFYFAKIVKLHDKGLFLRGKQGERYKYFIELSVSDGIPKVLQTDFILPIKDAIAVTKDLLAKAETPLERNEEGEIVTPGNYNFLTNQWSAEFLASNGIFQPLRVAISRYFSALQLLGIPTRNYDADGLRDSILPNRNGSLDSLRLFYKSLVQAESILVLMYDKVTNHEVGLAGELYANKKMTPSNARTNIIDVCFYTNHPITVNKRESMIADFGHLNTGNIRLPREIYLEIFRSAALTAQRRRAVSGPLIFQGPEGPLVINEVRDKITQYDFFLDYINKAQKSNPFFPISNSLVPPPTSRPVESWPLNLDMYKKSVANIASYLPSTTFEIPSINKSFRSTAESISEDNDGLESLAYSNLEGALFAGYRQQSNLENYISDLSRGTRDEEQITFRTLDDQGAERLSVILEVMKTIENFQEEYDAFSILETQPTTHKEFIEKYFPPVGILMGITDVGTVRPVADDDNLQDFLFLYVDNTDEKYKKLNFIIVNSVR